MMTDDERNAWLASRQEAGLKIDPETAEVEWTYAQTLDPYGVYPLLPEEYCVGREYFARSPGSDVWVCLETCPTQSKVRYGKSTSRSWPFQQDFRRLFEAVTAPSRLTLVRLHTDLAARAESAAQCLLDEPRGRSRGCKPGRIRIYYRGARAAEMSCDRQRNHSFRQVRAVPLRSGFHWCRMARSGATAAPA